MASHFRDDIDLAECGIKPLHTPDTETTLQDSLGAYDQQEPTGRTGSARIRQKDRALRFFPACERPLFMTLDYLAAQLWELQQQLEQLEFQNRQSGAVDYKEHLPNNDYGIQKKALMEEVVRLVSKYFEISNSANGVLSQPSPDVQYVNRYRMWACYHLSPDPADKHHAADNYRFVGPRPSGIDASFHAFLDSMSNIWPFRRRTSRKRTRQSRGSGKQPDEADGTRDEEEGEGVEEGIIVVEHSNALFRGFSHTVMITFAFIFLLLPPTLVCLTNISELMTVLVMVAFCLCFFLVIVVLFGSLSTEHKFLLFFAYCGAMVTMLSITSKNGVSISNPGVTGI